MSRQQCHIEKWYIDRWWAGCYVWYSEEGIRRGRSLPRLLLVVRNVTANPLTASVPITVSPLLCSFHVLIKGLISKIPNQ